MHMNLVLYHPMYKQADVLLEGQGTTTIHEYMFVI